MPQMHNHSFKIRIASSCFHDTTVGGDKFQAANGSCEIMHSEPMRGQECCKISVGACPAIVTLLREGFKVGANGMRPSIKATTPSAIALKECRDPSTFIFGETATDLRNSSIEDGKRKLRNEYWKVLDQLVPGAEFMLHSHVRGLFIS